MLPLDVLIQPQVNKNKNRISKNQKKLSTFDLNIYGKHTLIFLKFSFFENIKLASEGCNPGYFRENCRAKCVYPYFGKDCRVRCDCGENLCVVSSGCFADTTG